MIVSLVFTFCFLFLESSIESREIYSSACEEVAPCSRDKIFWKTGQKLKVADFEGPLGSERHTAEANTGILTTSRAGKNPATFEVVAQTFFNPCKSWFRHTKNDQSTLVHEQLHFDITELFSRKLIKAYATQIDAHASFVRKHERIYNQYWNASRKMQDEYDNDVYGDPALQEVWNKKVAKQLAALHKWSDKKIEIPME